MEATDHKLLCGDALSLLAEEASESVDLIIADPPYNLGKNYGNNIDLKERAEYQTFTRAWLEEARRILKPGGSLFCFMGVKFIARLYVTLEEELELTPQGWITWHYTQGIGRKRGFSPRHEDILWFSKGEEATFNLDDVRIPQKYYRKRNNMAGANPGDVWQFSHVHYCAAERQPHPTQKPEALIERIIMAASNAGDVVLDPFMGSGTTNRVAKILGRHSIGFDINPDYLEMSKTRLDQPFEGFDSIDPRKDRAPKDVPTKKAAEEAAS
ncbi:site-specific DNA-methyltransferase [Sneathiella sp. P13V-1]|uniref:DNA-methyltransferase n=1 Tax=Sneathiella sp. P13V-1 TaxID=2697366 RepID=UPI00187B7BBA|nr:site-specific DNA-methyltransferase [Sneathiella sp. P13V-1]MBE7636051.1 site-specific DNA-methyltransferase [Sneathiella sp. P13V-1]